MRLASSADTPGSIGPALYTFARLFVLHPPEPNGTSSPWEVFLIPKHFRKQCCRKLIFPESISDRWCRLFGSGVDADPGKKKRRTCGEIPCRVKESNWSMLFPVTPCLNTKTWPDLFACFGPQDALGCRTHPHMCCHRRAHTFHVNKKVEDETWWNC